MGMVVINGKVITTGDLCGVVITGDGAVVVDGVSHDCGAFKGDVVFKVEGSLVSLTVERGSAHVAGNVGESVRAGTVVSVGGSVAGDVKAGTTVTCGNVAGDVKAGTTVTCGDVKGNAKAGTSMYRK